MPACAASTCASDEPMGARTLTTTQSPAFRSVTAPTVVIPFRQTRISVLSPIENDCCWPAPSIARRAGRLPPSTVSCTDVELAFTSSPRNWKRRISPAAVAPAATAAQARTTSARSGRARCFIGWFLLGLDEAEDEPRSPSVGLARVKRTQNSPGRWVVHPAPADHRRDDLRVEVVPWVAVEHDQVGVVAGKQRAAPALVARKPRRRDAGRAERLLDGQRL